MNEKKLLRIVLLFVASLLLLTFLFPHKPVLKNWSEFSFSTSSQSRIYFHNIRSFWYLLEEENGQGIRIHRYKKWSQNTCGIYPMIVEQWKTDEASIYFEFKTASDTCDALHHIVLGHDTMEIKLSHLNREQFARIGYDWLTCIRDSKPYVFITDAGETIQPSPEEVNYTQTVLRDYFTLVNFIE